MFFLRLLARGGARKQTQTGYFQQRPRQPFHKQAIHRHFAKQQYSNQHGRTRAVFGQHLRGAVVANGETGEYLFKLVSGCVGN